MARTSWFSLIRWWGPLCTRPTRLVDFLYWNNSPRVDMLPQSDKLFRFRANQSLLFHLNAACLAEKQQISILKSLVSLHRSLNPLSTALEASMLTITEAAISGKGHRRIHWFKYRFYDEIVTDITTRNSERKNTYMYHSDRV